jgi:hypothetical protein
VESAKSQQIYKELDETRSMEERRRRHAGGHNTLFHYNLFSQCVSSNKFGTKMPQREISPFILIRWSKSLVNYGQINFAEVA